MRKPEEITSYEFKKGRGYKAEEVDDYLRSVSTDYRRLYLENQSVQEKLLLVTRELQDYKDREDGRPVLREAEASVPAADIPEDTSYMEALKEENQKLRSQLKEAEKLLSQKFEGFRNQYISFLEAHLAAIKSEDFSFSLDAQTQQMLKQEVPVPVEKEVVRSHKKSDDLFQMLDHMNQQMKEESDARMLQKIADEVASVQKETAGSTEEDEEAFDPKKPTEKEEKQADEKKSAHREEKPTASTKRETGDRRKKEGTAANVSSKAPAKKEGRKIPVVKNASIKSGTAEKKAAKENRTVHAEKRAKGLEPSKEKTLVEKLAEEVEASDSMGQTIVFQPIREEEASDMDKTIIFQPVHSEKGESGQ